MKVSVCVPAFNAEKYLEECLLSIKHQTREPYEILVLNDGSTDSTQLIAEKHIKNVFTHQINKGIGATRQKATELADGDHVAFLSADDVYHRYFLELVMREADGKSILFSDYWRCDEQLKPTSVFMAPHYATQEHFRRLVIEWALRQNMFCNFSTIIIPKHVFNQVQFHEDLRYGEDLVFLVETVLAKTPWRHVALPLVYYRIHKQAGTHKGWNPQYRRRLWEKLGSLLLSTGVPKAMVEASMQQSFNLAVRAQRKKKVPEPIKKFYRKLRELTL